MESTHQTAPAAEPSGGDRDAAGSEGGGPEAEIRIEHFPPLDEERRAIEAPVVAVTLLEDRAQVTRRARFEVGEGLARLVVPEIAPVLQDVSLQATVLSGPARVTDASVQRAYRVRRRDRPGELGELDEAIEELERRYERLGEERARLHKDFTTIAQIFARGVEEFPQDVAWGQTEHNNWRENFEALTERGRRFASSALERYHEQRDVAEAARRAAMRRASLERPDRRAVAWLDLDMVGRASGAVEVEIDYVVPNAMWRPVHTARLEGERLEFTASAAVWQRTGEDWTDAELTFSTAQTSLGTEPPVLHDDRIRAQRKAEEVVVEAREVEVQKAGASGASAPAPAEGVDLPGVDDGGEVRTLSPEEPTTIVSDGRPAFIPLFTFEAEAQVERVAMPERAARVFVKSTQRNEASWPILAGPVELVRDSGTVGWSETLFVGPGASFELGFGPEEDIRLTRVSEQLVDRRDPVDQWHYRITEVELYVSNLGDEAHHVEITERIPVSEIEHVRVELVDAETAERFDLEESTADEELAPDENGFCRWTRTIEGRDRHHLRLVYLLATAPDVRQPSS